MIKCQLMTIYQNQMEWANFVLLFHLITVQDQHLQRSNPAILPQTLLQQLVPIPPYHKHHPLPIIPIRITTTIQIIDQD